MPEITPEAEALLEGLAASPLNWLASLAREQFDAEEPFSALPEISDRQQLAFHQVKVIAEIVDGQISQELELTKALHKSARELELKTVMVLPFSETAEQEGDQLLDPGRIEALATFADAWREIVRDLLTNLEIRS